MSKSVLYMSMSLDGFITGPGDDAEHGLGVDGERLHDWLGEWDGSPARSDPPGPSGQVFDELMATGAVVVGRRTFDLAGRWNGDHHGVPIFVPTRGTPPARSRLGPLRARRRRPRCARPRRPPATRTCWSTARPRAVAAARRAARRAGDQPGPGPPRRGAAAVRAPRRRPHRARADPRARRPGVTHLRYRVAS